MGIAKCCGATLGCFWVLTAAIWIGVYMGIWRPYFDVNWNDSDCVIQNVTNYIWTYISSSGSHEASYASISVLVNISSHWVQGFACGMPNSYSFLLGSNTTNNEFPNNHGLCQNPDACGKMELLPAWWCSDCKGCMEKLTNQVVPCHWTLSAGAGETDPGEWPLGYRLERPMPYSAYLEVVLREEVYYNQGEYIFLHVYGGIGILVPPLVLCVYVVKRLCSK